jgi:preprotein translocase subunit SecE
MIKDTIKYLRQVQVEFSKVVWPSWAEFVGSTIIVLILVVLFTIYLGALDFGFSKLMRYIFTLYGAY